ncbi:MAG: GNAT family N-acetyltransferase [Planctomycetota bacterium]
MNKTRQKCTPLDWVRNNLLPQGGIAVSSLQQVSYPEVSGYFVPTLLKAGEERLAQSLLTWLVSIQNKDGSFNDPADVESYSFDTGQILRGLVAGLERDPGLEIPARAAADWLIDNAGSDGRLRCPTSRDAWDLGDRGSISEAVHLYCLPPLVALGEQLGERRYLEFAQKSRDAYLALCELARFESRNQLTHLYCYVQDALFDLGAHEAAQAGMAALARYQRNDGSIPAYFDVNWVCSPGQIQSAIIWKKLGDGARATAAFEFAQDLMQTSGAWLGSYGEGADYFANDEPSWAVKFYLDAAALMSESDSPGASSSPPPKTQDDAPERRGKTLDSNLPPDEWHDSIAGDVDAAKVMARIRKHEVPAWIEPVREQTQAGQRVLELGSGTGELSAELARDGREVTLVDFSDKSLELAEAVFAGLNLQGTFTQADVLKRLPFPDDHFDCVWSSGLLEHFDDDQIAHIVTESARVSRGLVLALVPNARSFPYRLGKWHQEKCGDWLWGREDPKHDLSAVFTAAGLVAIEETSIAARHALNFLEMPEAASLKSLIAEFYDSLPASDLKAMQQGYLLVTTGKKSQVSSTRSSKGAKQKAKKSSPKKSSHKPPRSSKPGTFRRLAVIPHDPLHEYEDAGYPDLTRYFNPTGLFDEVFCLSPYETVEHRRYGMKVIPTPAGQLADRIRELNIDVVRAYDVFAGRHAAAERVFGVPLVVSVHDSERGRFEPGLPDADRFIAISNVVENRLLEFGADKNRIDRLPNRVDLEVFRPSPDPARKAAFEARFPGRYRILHVGRKSEQKNIDQTLRALAELGKDYCGIFVGRGDNGPYQELAQKLGLADRCYFLDSVPNAQLSHWYQDADCLCVPSRWEGFGIIFIEALASGAAVVTSDIQPMNEFMADGVNSLLAPDPEDSSGIAARIRMACEDHSIRDRIRERAPKAAIPFSRESIDSREANLYRSLLATRDNYRIEVSSRLTESTAAKPLPSHNFTVQALQRSLAPAWDEVVNSSPDAWFFHSFDEQVLLEEAWPGETFSFVVEVEGRTVAVCPLQRWRYDPGVLHSTLMGTGGPALADDLTANDRQAVLEFTFGVLRNMVGHDRIRQVSISLPPGSRTCRASWNHGLNPLSAQGFQDVSTTTSVIDLSRGLDEILANLHPSYRHDIRRAEKSGLTVELATKPSDLDAYYALHEETYHRTGVEPHPRAYFESIFKHFVSCGRAHWFMAKHEGSIIGAANIAHANDWSMYWTGAYSQDALHLRAGKLLQWEAIKWAHGKGLAFHETGEVFPLADPKSKEAGLTLFKRRFGGRYVPFFRGIYDGNSSS